MHPNLTNLYPQALSSLYVLFLRDLIHLQGSKLCTLVMLPITICSTQTGLLASRPIFTYVDEKCHLPYQPTNDGAAIKPSATVAVPTVHSLGIQAGEKQDAGPR